jgi:hypothetical protein
MPTGKYNFTELNQNIGSYTEYVREYLEFLINGDGKKAHCPFTKNMLLKKKFYYDVSERILLYEEFCLAINQMKDFIQEKNDRYTVAGIVYADNLNFSSEMATMVEKFRQKHRVDFINNGLTIAWTHPKNRIGTHTNKDKPDYPLWVSKVPILMVRNLDKGDEPFMLTEETKRAFANGIKISDKRND